MLATDDDIPGLTELLAFDNLPVELSNWVGRDPRMFSRGASPERIAQLQELAAEFEPLATTHNDTSHNALRLNVARANYAMALITAEMTANDNTGDWGLAALNDLEELHRMNPDDDETTILLARVNRLLGQVETGQDHPDRAVAHQLFASDLIGGLLEGHQQDPGLQLEWGIQQTYLGEAELKFDKAQHASQAFQIAIVCFEENESLSSDPPQDDPATEALWRSQDSSRRYFQAYNFYSLGLLLTRANQALTAREYWTRSLDLFEGLAEEFPASLKFRQRYAQAISNEGSRQAAAQEVTGSLDTFLIAGELYAQLVEEAPWDTTNQYGLAMALGNQAMLLAVSERHAEALPVSLRSLEVWDTYVSMRPDDAVAFRQAVVWKTAELLAGQAAEALPEHPDDAMDLAQEEHELVTEHWDASQLLQDSTTLHGLELQLAEEVYEFVVAQRGGCRTGGGMDGYLGPTCRQSCAEAG